VSLYESIADEDPYDDANLPLVNPDRGGTTGHPYGATSSVETIQEKLRRLERQLARQKRRAARANEAAEQLRLDVINLRRRAVYAEQSAKWWKSDATRAFYANARTLIRGQER
jgi:hypothetical protein